MKYFKYFFLVDALFRMYQGSQRQLKLRHSVWYSPPYFGDIACWVAILSTVLCLSEWKNDNKLNISIPRKLIKNWAKSLERSILTLEFPAFFPTNKKTTLSVCFSVCYQALSHKSWCLDSLKFYKWCISVAAIRTDTKSKHKKINIIFRARQTRTYIFRSLVSLY